MSPNKNTRGKWQFFVGRVDEYDCADFYGLCASGEDFCVLGIAIRNIFSHRSIFHRMFGFVVLDFIVGVWEEK